MAPGLGVMGEKPAAATTKHLSLGSMASGLREAYESGRTKDMEWRQSQLRGLISLLTDKEEEIFDVLHEDLGKHRGESFRDELGILVKSVKYTLQNLKKWAAPEKAEAPLVAFPATAMVVPEPLGVVLIFSCWNFPLGLALEPLSGALAAGNAVVLKPSELAPSTAAFLAANIPKYLDSRAVKVVLGGPNVGEELMEHRWDKLLFTGSERVGRIIMTKAAKHLTPIELMKSTLKRFMAKPGGMARILNEKHFQRLSAYLEDTKVKKIEDSIAFLKPKPKPLAIYAFTTNESLKRRIVEETSSGSVTFNDAVVQYALESVPFGGVGHSGFGQYHGKYSFELFSNKKAVFRRSFLIEFMFRYPPWDDSKIGTLRHVFSYSYILLFLTLLGLRR
ncbi:hypothetical protein GUJ93_ZPchr0006g41071 [Zizania palustris]|uniref:Aldehyde dehydrogenase domain-containing protein n=1 Tax=Zizania palustris TaxID=103762 RepID=A0A8J5SFY7_ZIZPA|nr:hypothetical protein GUJ93_ZPchr0006g41071 [Zizania palustris]